MKKLKSEKIKLKSDIPIAVKVSPDLNDKQIEIVSNSNKYNKLIRKKRRRERLLVIF